MWIWDLEKPSVLLWRLLWRWLGERGEVEGEDSGNVPEWSASIFIRWLTDLINIVVDADRYRYHCYKVNKTRGRINRESELKSRYLKLLATKSVNLTYVLGIMPYVFVFESLIPSTGLTHSWPSKDICWTELCWRGNLDSKAPYSIFSDSSFMRIIRTGRTQI